MSTKETSQIKSLFADQEPISVDKQPKVNKKRLAALGAVAGIAAGVAGAHMIGKTLDNDIEHNSDGSFELAASEAISRAENERQNLTKGQLDAIAERVEKAGGHLTITTLEPRIHSDVKVEGDTVVPDQLSPLVDREPMTELHTPRAIIAGDLSFDGPYRLQTYVGQGPDGADIWKDMPEGEQPDGPLQLHNGIVENAHIGETNEIAFIGGTDGYTPMRAVVSYGDFLDATDGHDTSLTVNGEEVDLGHAMTLSQARGRGEVRGDYLFGNPSEGVEGIIGQYMMTADAVDAGSAGQTDMERLIMDNPISVRVGHEDVDGSHAGRDFVLRGGAPQMRIG